MGGGERYEDIRLHSTALSLCTAAKCPVAVVRGVAGVVPDDGPVVLGVESVDADAVAVTVAFADAQRHGTGLIVVHAVRGTGLLRDHLIGYDVHSRRGRPGLLLGGHRGSRPPGRSRHPEVPVEIRVVDLPAPGHLLQAAVSARLVVVGTRGRNLATRVVLGSVSHHRRAERALPRGRGAPRHAAGRVGPVRRRTCAREAGGPSPEALGPAPARPPAALVTASWVPSAVTSGSCGAACVEHRDGPGQRARAPLHRGAADEVRQPPVFPGMRRMTTTCSTAGAPPGSAPGSTGR